METKALKIYDNIVYSRMVGLGGEIFMADRNQLVNTMGIKVLYGALKTINSDNPDYIGGGLTPSDGFHPIYDNATFQEGRVEGPTEWVCVMRRNEADNPVVSYEEINETFTLPANTGLIVVNGSVVVDGNAVSIDEYVSPTGQARQVTGVGKAILIA